MGLGGMTPVKKAWLPRTAAGQVAVQLVRRYYLHDVGRDSAALTYYLLFALFPLMVFVSTLLGILKLDVDNISQFLSQLVPADVVSVLEAYLIYVSANASRQLLWFSLVFSIWFPMRATSCLLHSLRKAFNMGPPRKMLLNQLAILLFTVWLILSIGLTLLLVTVGRRALEFVSGLIALPQGFIDLWSYLRFIVLGVVMFLMLTVLYMLAQGQRRPLKEVAPGVGISLAAWMVLSLAFSYYVEHFANYSVLYGSIATVVVVLLWLYMSGTVLIMGAEYSAVILRRRRRPSGSGEEQA